MGKSLGNQTRTVGVNGCVALVSDVSGSVGITTDHNGNIGVIITTCAGAGTPAASASVFKTVTNAPEIYDQRGLSAQVGGSGEVSGLSVGAEYSVFYDYKNEQTYQGITILEGVSAPAPVSVEMHVEFAYSFVYGFNIYDSMKLVYDQIMEW